MTPKRQNKKKKPKLLIFILTILVVSALIFYYGFITNSNINEKLKSKKSLINSYQKILSVVKEKDIIFSSLTITEKKTIFQRVNYYIQKDKSNKFLITDDSAYKEWIDIENKLTNGITLTITRMENDKIILSDNPNEVGALLYLDMPFKTFTKKLEIINRRVIIPLQSQ